MPIIYVLALTMGVAAGIRPMLALAVVAWQISLRHIDLDEVGLGLFSRPGTPWLLTFAAIIELALDNGSADARRQLPRFTMRLIAGALGGAVVVAPNGDIPAGLLCGLAGAVLGCVGGISTRHELRRLVKSPIVASVAEGAVVFAAVAAIFGRAPVP